MPLALDDLAGLVSFCRDESIELVVPGPELPLVLGLVDRLEAAGIRAFGPSAAAARLEGSKAFAKEFCARHGIPTAPFRAFTADAGRCRQGARARAWGAGRGQGGRARRRQGGDRRQPASRRRSRRSMPRFGGAFGEAGSTVLVEDCLVGEEVSLFALVDGAHVLEFGTAQDHKRAGEGDTGPNTGGMGAYAPAPCMTPALTERAMAEIVRPTVAGMAAEGTPVSGRPVRRPDAHRRPAPSCSSSTSASATPSARRCCRA